jgi:hypothetical protein
MVEKSDAGGGEYLMGLTTSTGCDLIASEIERWVAPASRDLKVPISTITIMNRLMHTKINKQVVDSADRAFSNLFLIVALRFLQRDEIGAAIERISSALRNCGREFKLSLLRSIYLPAQG